jgi:Na+/H+-translocating membrane pyrophosphatase
MSHFHFRQYTGMGSDLFGSFAESTCAALVIGSSIGISGGWSAMMFPVVVSAVGLFVCLVCSFIATDIVPVKSESQVESALKTQLISTTVLMIPALYFAGNYFLPAKFTIAATVGFETYELTPVMAVACVCMGAVGGLIIGLVTEYYTSHSYAPVREVANACKTGAATNMIYGIALGYKSAIIPVLVLSVVIYGSFTMCDMYGVALAAIGFLSNLATGLTIDVYGPVCDNAGGIAEMVRWGTRAIYTDMLPTSFYSDTTMVFFCRLNWMRTSAKRRMPLMLPVTPLPLLEKDLPLVRLLSYRLPSLVLS